MPPRKTKKNVSVAGVVDENADPLTQTESNEKAAIVKKSKPEVQMTNAELTEYYTDSYPELLEKAIINVKGQKTLIKKLCTDYEEVVEKCCVNLLRRAVWTSTFIAVPEGRRLVSRAFEKIGVVSVTNLIKKAVLNGASNSTCNHYGEMMVMGWKHAVKEGNDKLREDIETDMLTPIAHDALVLPEPYAKKFQFVLGYLNLNKKDKARLDNAIYKSFLAVLWRCIVAPNDRVRYNACMVMLDFYPINCSDPDDKNDILAKQHEAISQMLVDECTMIRQDAIKKVLKIICGYWQLLDRKKDYLTVICDQLSRDSDIGTRLAVFEGLQCMLMEPNAMNATERALQCVCPHGINDKNERVRLATFKLLRALRGHRYIKFFDIVPLEEIMARFELETSEEVRSQIVPLIFRTFYPVDNDQNERVDRVSKLARFGRVAALTFHRMLYPLKLITVKEAATQIKSLSLSCYKSARNGFVGNVTLGPDATMGLDDTIGTLSSTDQLPINENSPDWIRNKVLMECGIVMWMSIRHALLESAHEAEKIMLDTLQTKTFKKMFQCFRTTSLIGTTMVLGSVLPPSSLDGITSSVLSLLNEKVVDECIMEPYLEATAQWRIEYLIDIIHDGLDVLRSCTELEPTGKKTKKNLTPVDRLKKALSYMKYLMRSSSASQKLIYNHTFELEQFYKKLTHVRSVIDSRIGNTLALSIPDDVIVETYKVKQTLAAILINCVASDEDCGQQLRYVREVCEDIQWFNTDVVVNLALLANDERLEFVISLSEAMLYQMTLFIISWDFSGVPSISQAPSFVRPNESQDMSAMTLDFLHSSVQTVVSFASSSTPPQLITPVLQASKVLLDADPGCFVEIVKIFEMLPKWIIDRHEEKEEMDDKKIADAYGWLWKSLQNHPSYTENMLSRHLQVMAASTLQYVITDAQNKMDLEDPRIPGYEVPLPVSLIIHNVIFKNPHHEKISVSLLAILGGMFCKDELVSEETDAEECLLNLGACCQMAFLCDLKSFLARKAGKNANGSLSESAKSLLLVLKDRVAQIEKRERRPITDNLVLSQVKELFE